MRRKCLWTSAVLVAAAALIAASGWWASASPGDIGRLAEFVPLCNYETLEAELGQPDLQGFSFAVLGDCRSNTLVATKVYGKAAEMEPDMIFHTGDMIRGGTVDEFADHYLPLVEMVRPIPLFSVPGNHERGKRRDFAAYRYLHGGDRFSFDYGNSRFVGFNGSGRIRVTRDDLRFLEEELSKPGAEHKFVFFHIPPLYAEEAFLEGARRGFTWNADRMHALFVEHGVTEVFMGHIHGFASEVLDGVRYTLTAGGGAPFDTRLPLEDRIFHFVEVRVTPEGVSREVVYLDPPTGEWRRRPVEDAGAAAEELKDAA